jgi:hypothetical protein
MAELLAQVHPGSNGVRARGHIVDAKEHAEQPLGFFANNDDRVALCAGRVHVESGFDSTRDSGVLASDHRVRTTRVTSTDRPFENRARPVDGGDRVNGIESVRGKGSPVHRP